MAGLLNGLIFVPVIGAILLAVIPSTKLGRLSTIGAFVASTISSLIGIFIVIAMRFNWVPPASLVQKTSWLSSYSIFYHVGVDGLNLLLILALSLLFPVLIASEWSAPRQRHGLQALLLLLQSALLGTVCSYDLFLQFLFWAATSQLIYFMIGMWGSFGRERAANSYAVTSLMGNALLFVAMLLVYYAAEPHTFSIYELSPEKIADKNLQIFGREWRISKVVFLLASFGMALRVPVWPIHGWISDLSSKSPQSVVAAIYGGVIPAGFYIFLRTAYVLYRPELEIYGSWLIGVGILSMAMGALGAIGQKNLRGLLAQLCLAQCGFSLIGVASLSATGVVGAMIQSVSVGLALSGLALFVNAVLERVEKDFYRGGKWVMSGFARQAPTMALFSGIFVLTMMCVPLSGSFMGATLILMGGYLVHPVVLLFAIGMVFLMSVSLMLMYRSVFFGKNVAPQGTHVFSDFSFTEKIYLIPIVIALLGLGFYPKPLLEVIRISVTTLLMLQG